MAPPDSAVRHYREQKAITASTVRQARQVWSELDPTALDESWRAGRLSERLFVTTSTGQMLAASRADGYLDRVLTEQDIDADSLGPVSARAFAGVASDGRNLETLLHEPIIRTKVALGAGAVPAQALRSGEASLVRIVGTQVQDAGRGAVQAGMVTRPAATRWVRMLNPPSCARCAVLAGRVYRWNADFDRHPLCRCTAAPSNEDIAGDLTTNPRAYFDSLTAEDQDRCFTPSGAESIRRGADIGQVVNSRRTRGSLYTADGRNFTTEGTTRRGIAGKRLGGQRRMTPGQILAESSDRDEALALLEQHGYVIARAPRPQLDLPTPAPAPSTATATRVRATVQDPDVLAEARRRNVSPERVIELRNERAERRALERQARKAAEKELSADHPDVVRVAERYGVHPDEVLSARHRVAEVRAVAREEAAKVQAEAMRELDRLGTIKLKNPPRKGAVSEHGTALRRGEWDWLEQVSDREKNRLSRQWYGGTQGPDQFAQTMSEALGRDLDVGDAMERWLDLNRRAEASGAVRRGKLPSLDAYSGQIDPQDLIGSLADDGFDAVRLFGDELDAAGHVAFVERELAQADALGYLGDAARAVEGPAPYRMGFQTWEEEVRDLEFSVQEGTATARERRRLAELVPEALDEPGLDYEPLYARIVATARKAGEEVPAHAVIPWA